MEHFSALGLPEPLMQSLARLQFNEPTPIQAKAIPVALDGRDILGSAQTGTGKTLAFCIPIIAKLMSNPRGSALIISPTRELASQINKAVHDLLGKKSPLRTALLIGGEHMGKQLDQLKRRPRLFIGTPGRINDHLNRGSLALHDSHFLVLDETDRMLDMGFSVQIDQIIKYLPQKRQTMLFSATMPKNIISMSEAYLVNPERIAIGSPSVPVDAIKHEVFHVTEQEKHAKLTEQLNERHGSIVVFVKTKYNAEKMAKRLRSEGHSAEAIHGDLRHNKRERVIQMFRKLKFRILVATDIAARGLDIPHIEHVINYNLPQCPEDYIHRIGRTARAGAQGNACCFVSPNESKLFRAINALLNPDEAHSSKPPKKNKRKRSRNNQAKQGNNPAAQKQKNNARTKHKRPFKGKKSSSQPKKQAA